MADLVPSNDEIHTTDHDTAHPQDGVAGLVPSDEIHTTDHDNAHPQGGMGGLVPSDEIHTTDHDNATNRTPQRPQENSMQQNTPKTGVKRCLVYNSHLALQSPAGNVPAGKKYPMYGYVIQLGMVLKGRTGAYYNFQLQTDKSDVQTIAGFDTGKYKDSEVFFKKSTSIWMDVRRSIKDGSLMFDEKCYVMEATELQVTFEVNEHLKRKLIEESSSTLVNLETLVRIDPFNSENRNKKYTVRGLVTFGNLEMEEIPINQGASTALVKNDILIEEGSGNILFRLFENQLQKVTSGKCHEITHLILKRFKGKPYVHTSKSSVITEVEDLDIQSQGDLILTGCKSITVKEFTGVKDIDIFDLCPAENKKLNIVKQTTNNVWCKCGALVKKTRLEEKSYSCSVEYQDKDNNFVWVKVFSDTLRKIFPQAKPTAEELQEFLMELGDVSFHVNESKIEKFV